MAPKGGKNRDEETSSYRPEGGDHQWTVERDMVPSVIRGSDWIGWDHTPGTVAELRGHNRPVDESAIVERLSQRQTEESESTSDDENFWRLTTGGRGVVMRPKPERHDANDW